jgi:hypothetical protein
MEPTKLFLRAPREISFFRDQARMILALADECSRGVPVREDDDEAQGESLNHAVHHTCPNEIARFYVSCTTAERIRL